jgi:hypothetical protein
MVPAPPDREWDAGELADMFGWDVVKPGRCPFSGRPHKESVSRVGPDDLNRFEACGCIDVEGTDARRLAEQVRRAQMGRRYQVAPPTGGDDW